MDKFIKSFVACAQIALTYRAESLVNEIVGQPEMVMYKALRSLFNESLFDAVIGYVLGGSDEADPRLVRVHQEVHL